MNRIRLLAVAGFFHRVYTIVLHARICGWLVYIFHVEIESPIIANTKIELMQLLLIIRQFGA